MKANKEVFFKPHWVEERHEYLMSLPRKEARHLLQTFDDYEIEDNVNDRTYQSSYICDYLEDLWGISTRSFWKHIQISLTHEDGTLISDNNNHIEIMKSYKMPLKVLQNLLLAIPSAINGYFFDDHLDILFSQLDNFENKQRIELFRKWFLTQSPEIKKNIKEYVQKHVNNEILKSIVLSS